MKHKNIFWVFGIILAAIIYRLLPHPSNFSPVNAVFLFGGAIFAKRFGKIALVFAIVFLSDFLLNNTIMRPFFEQASGLIWFAPYMLFNYISFALIVGIGYFVSHKKAVHIVLGAAASSVIFYLITNAGAWAFDPLHFYPNGINGLFMSLAAGLPFLQWTLLSDILFAGVLFGLYNVAIQTFQLETVRSQK